jgi:hypothetical protein
MWLPGGASRLQQFALEHVYPVILHAVKNGFQGRSSVISVYKIAEPRRLGNAPKEA